MMSPIDRLKSPGFRPLASITFVVVATAVAWAAGPAVASTLVFASILAALYPRIETVVEFSFGPLKARLERNVAESERLLASLRRIAIRQSKFILDATAAAGDFYNDPDLYSATTEVRSWLDEIGATAADISEATHGANKKVVGQLGWTAMGSGGSPKFDKGGEWIAICGNPDKFGNPEVVEAWLKKQNLLTPERIELIDEMRWIIANGRIRDGDQVRRSKMRMPLPPQNPTE